MAFLIGHLGSPLSFSRSLLASHNDEEPTRAERPLAPSLNPKGTCAIKFLSRLGWKVEGGGSDSKVQFEGKDFCFANNLEDLQKSGKAKLTLPKDFDNLAEEVKFYLLADVIDSEASRCLYRIKLSVANISAAYKMAQNQQIHFTPSRMPGNNNAPANALVDTTAKLDWDVESAMFAMHAISTPSKAMNALLDPKYHHALDCYAGTATEALMAQKELYGDADFDKAFKNRDIIVGGAWVIMAGDENYENPLTAESVAFPPNYDDVKRLGFEDRNGVKSTQLGGHSLLGRRGVVGSVLGEEFLDNKADVNENLVFVSMKTNAEKELKRIRDPYQFTLQVGASYWIENLKRELRGWVASQEKKEQLKKALVQFYLKYPDARFWNTASLAKELDTNPIFNDIQVYVHPLGIQTLNWHWKRLSNVNPGTPYALEIFPTNLMTTMYDRYKNFYLNKCR